MPVVDVPEDVFVALSEHGYHQHKDQWGDSCHRTQRRQLRNGLNDSSYQEIDVGQPEKLFQQGQGQKVQNSVVRCFNEVRGELPLCSLLGVVNLLGGLNWEDSGLVIHLRPKFEHGHESWGSYFPENSWRDKRKCGKTKGEGLRGRCLVQGVVVYLASLLKISGSPVKNINKKRKGIKKKYIYICKYLSNVQVQFFRLACIFVIYTTLKIDIFVLSFDH